MKFLSTFFAAMMAFSVAVNSEPKLFFDKETHGSVTVRGERMGSLGGKTHDYCIATVKSGNVKLDISLRVDRLKKHNESKFYLLLASPDFVGFPPTRSMPAIMAFYKNKESASKNKPGKDNAFQLGLDRLNPLMFAVLLEEQNLIKSHFMTNKVFVVYTPVFHSAFEITPDGIKALLRCESTYKEKIGWKPRKVFHKQPGIKEHEA